MQDTVDRKQNKPLLGIALKVGAVCCFIAMFTLVKLSGQVPAGQIVFFRSFFALIPVLIWVFWQGNGVSDFRTNDFVGHLWRGVIGVTSMALGFYALTVLPLPEAVLIGYAMPLFTVVMGAVLLKEQVRAYRWAAVIIGLIGVMIVSWPRLTLFGDASAETSQLAIGALAVIGSAAFAAGAMIQIRRLTGKEPAITIVIYFTVISACISLVSAFFGWITLDAWQLTVLVLAGIVGGIGQIFLTSCYRYADVSTIAPFEYVSLILSLGIGWLVFDDLPTIQMLVGGLIVVGAGLFIIWREHQLGLERKRAKQAQSI
ncbi:MAG: DMT family transporter [Rhizobiaceae bacterium]